MRFGRLILLILTGKILGDKIRTKEVEKPYEYVCLLSALERNACESKRR